MAQQQQAPDGSGLTGGMFGGGFFTGGPLDGAKGHVPGVEGYYVYRGQGGVWEEDPVAWVEEGEDTVSIEGQGLAPVASDSNCKLYLSFNGADGGLAVSDHSQSDHEISVAGSFELDDGQVQFGPTSGHFTNSDSVLSIADHDDFYYGTGQFTIMVRFRRSPGSADSFFYRQFDDADNWIQFQYEEDLPSKMLFFNFNNGGAGPVGDIGDGIQVDVEDDTWHLAAVTKDGSNVIRLYLDGELVDSQTVATALPDLAADVVINPGGGMTGWLDDMVVIKGEALYIGESFTVPDRSYGHDDIERWQYRRRGVSPGGTMGDYSIVNKVVVDAGGAIHFDVGNEPQSLKARGVWNGPGEIELRWVYDSENQPATPTGFKIYIKNGAVWDYVDSVAYHEGGTPNYRWGSEAHAHGLEVEYKVVTYRTVSEVDYETAGQTVTIVADAQGPPAVTQVDIKIVDE